jgi:precorrin-8X/cobalt-precorrin-8 methylmutase
MSHPSTLNLDTSVNVKVLSKLQTIRKTMSKDHLTIKELTDAVGRDVTPRMVRHYHQLGLMPVPPRSQSNYRLYTQHDVMRLQKIVALKQKGFALSHVQRLLDASPQEDTVQALNTQLQQQYRSVLTQLAHLRQTASALEGVLGRDSQCQSLQAEALSGLKLLEVESQDGWGGLQKLWDSLDRSVADHPEEFSESLQHLLPDLSGRSEIEVDLLSKLVLACGDVSLVPFVRLSPDAIAAARHSLAASCQVVTDVPLVAAALDRTRLAHLGCPVQTLIDEPHITSVVEAEQAFWHNQVWIESLKEVQTASIFVIGYAPSVLMSVCKAIEEGQLQPALVIAMPVGFSHAPAAKRRLMQSSTPWITIEGTIGGGLLAAVTLNALAESLLEKPDCHCYLG